jgi:hypothetical protein
MGKAVPKTITTAATLNGIDASFNCVIIIRSKTSNLAAVGGTAYYNSKVTDSLESNNATNQFSFHIISQFASPIVCSPSISNCSYSCRA